MKTLYTSIKSVPVIIFAGILVLSIVNTVVFSQTADDTIHSVVRRNPVPDSLRTGTVKNVSDEIAELQQRKDVRTRFEITAKGDTITHYIYEPFDFGELYTSGSTVNANAKKAPADRKEASAETQPERATTTGITVQSIDQSKSVGQIPFEEGVTPSVGKTITVPILTAPVASAAPQVSLNYNSQMGNSPAGYGWNISGLTAINVTNKTIHYDGTSAPADLSNPSACAFSLDGTRLVTNNNTAVPDYHYETAQGYILVKKIMYGSNVAYFEALFPDGSKANYGFTNNTVMKHTYPVTSIVDMKGYRIDFEYLQSGNIYFISKIKYGSKTTTHPAEIRFEYVARTDYTTAYISNTGISLNQLLKKVTSYNNGQEIRTYTLTHTLESEVNRLTRLDCSSGTSSLNPLVFGYDYYPSYMTNGQFDEELYGFLSQYFNNTPANKMQYIRGKFRKNSFGDGMITFPGKFSTYGLLATRRRWVPFHYVYAYLYGSTYPADQTILIVPNLDFFSNSISITAESGFQTINAVDVNGDGVDEIVKVNFNGTSGSKTVLKVTVYTLTTGTAYTTRTFNVNVEGVVNSDDYYYSPVSRSYYFGDFRGDGQIQMVTVSHNKTFDNQDRTSYFAVVDLNSGILISENTLFSHSTYEDTYVHTFDVNGDAKSELCHASASAYNVYGLSGNSFTYQYGSTVVPRSAFYKKVKFGDLNADGKLDILVPPNDSYQDIQYVELPVWAPHNCPYCDGSEPITDSYSIHCRYCGMDLKFYYEQNPYNASCRECGLQLQTCYNDPNYPEQSLCCPTHGSVALAEIEMGYVDNGNQWSCYINTGKGFTATTQNIVNVEYDDKITVMDMNRDGLSDLIQIRGTQAKLYLNSKGTIQSSTPVNPINVPSGTSGFMPSNVVNYYNSSYLVCIKDAEIYTITYTKDESKANLLTLTTDSYGSLHQNNYSNMAEGGNYIPTTTSRSYPYASSIFPLNLLSSAYVTLPNYGNYIKHQYYTYYGAVIHQQGLGFCGFEKVRTFDYMLNMESVETKDPQMFGVTISLTSPLKESFYNYIRNEESNKQANPRAYNVSETDKLTNVYTYAYYDYDAYGNPTQVNHNIGSALNTVTNQTYHNSVSSSRYLIGQPLIKTVTNTRGGASWQDKEEITYDATTRLPLGRSTYTGTTAVNKTGETKWTYETNGSGNVASEKTAPYNVTEFLGNTYTYDPSGRYLASQTNAFSQTTTFSNYDKYGNARTVTDHKGRITTRTFDDWGQPVSVTGHDGVTEATTPAWGGQGVYTVTRTVTGQPSTVAHYDAAGRGLRKGNQRFDGQWQYVDNAYDNKGRLEKVSLPFRGASPSYWNSYSFDTYHRPTQLLEASGKTTSWSYNGLSVTETKNGIVTTKTTDASGALASVTDPGGTISYSLRPDGQPSSITAPGGVITSFEYDAFGRQTALVDPSAGRQTTEPVYSSAGVLTLTETNPKGTNVSVFDKYGRITSLQRQGEFTTNYVYNADELLAGETSTNGTSKAFTYDTFDRILTEKETVPDNKWLQKTYTYGDGNVSSVQYAAQSGTLGTESFLYAYGHNREIRLNGSTTIWKLTAENDPGQPTAANTGSMNRSYSYNDYGIPTGRTAGSIQNFSYSFDTQKGNLLSRTDNRYTRTETFGYDNLNRLTNAAGKVITYAGNGNITRIEGVGTMAYGNTDKPYQVTMLSPEGTAVPLRNQSVSYTSFQRPSRIDENGLSASFTYNASGGRVKMYVANGVTPVLTRYYIGGQYELDLQSNIERLYLGGDAYSAPAVLVKEAGVWNIYYICRDYLGSITHVANADGSLKQELSYDAWGRLRNPSTHVAYTPGSEPALFLGRGYTGHEHLTWFGLVNMNARLYDAALGRFLSPDPYVQMPDFTQNFNRYSYCLNNPLVYVDEDGEFIFSFFLPGIGTLIDAALWGGTINLISNWGNINNFGEALTAFGVGAGTGALMIVNPVLGITAGGALTGATNSAIQQLDGTNGLNDLNWGALGKEALLGVATSAVSYGTFKGLNASGFAEKVTTSLGIKGNWSKAISGISINSGITGATSGLTEGIGRGMFYNEWDQILNRTLTGGAFGTLGGLTYGLSQYAGFKMYTGIAEKNIMKAIDNLGTNIGESVHDVGTNLSSLSSQDVVGSTTGNLSSGNDINSVNVFAHKNGVVSVYTHIPNPINGAKPITNFYHYMDNNRLYYILKRLKF